MFCIMPSSIPTQQDRLHSIIKTTPLVTAYELRKQGITGAAISRAEASGLITRLSRGLYQGPQSEYDTNQTLAEIAKKVPNGVICLVSALAYHGLTDQMPRTAWVAIAQDAWAPKLTYPPIRYVRFKPKYLTEGIEYHTISGVSVPVYSVAKTLADAFRNPRLVDRSIAIEGLKNALAAHKATPSQIYEAAQKGGALNTIKPYLEALTSNG